MARRARTNMNTSFFHVIVQGINKEYIFEKDKYKEKYLQFIVENSKYYDIEIVSYCIMSNHAHFLIYTKNTKELSIFMKKINEDYARFYNYKEEREGYVFKGRFKSEPITDLKYLLNCMVYIHKNPVKARMVKECEEYNYSSYKEYLNKKKIINEELSNFIFGTKIPDINEFKKMHLKKNYYFMDYENFSNENIEEIIIEYEINYNMSWEKIIANKANIDEIIIDIKERMKISDNKLAKYLGIDRRRISRVVNNNML